ncbi:hypothetical protein [Vibrio caribbeanicus]|uniref:Lipoprotein, putative n=1 Tax=Vibrio caribbeanicus ATCC BAA-2122 TaxID=796620 RepID=E3BQ75_9VIBR|nr:hypothetical protein [Vibrio caribbeanicus]EFP94803.1 lipoprotein, putative [Vibrio caribbeanicus ATCC BAA-2122]
MIKAKYVAMVLGVAAVVGVTYWSKQRLVEPSAYQQELDDIVNMREFSRWGPGSETQESWTVPVVIPESAPIEQWDRVHTQPQLMFIYSSDATAYTMNLDGTEVRQLFDRYDLGDKLAKDGTLTRSPNGRYLSFKYFGPASDDCAVYDLKDKKLLATYDNCYGRQFSLDSEYLYFTGNLGVPSRLILATGETIELTPEVLELDGEKYSSFNTSSIGVNEAQDRLTWTINRMNLNGLGAKVLGRDQLIYRLSDMTLLGKEEFWTPLCAQGYRRSPDYRYFVCIEDRRNYIYDFDKPTELVEQAPEAFVLKLGQWYVDWKGKYVRRLRLDGETAKFESMIYHYSVDEEGNDFTTLRGLRAYIPLSLAKQLDDLDLAAVMPRIPTEEEYQATYQRLLAARNKKRGQ